MRLGIDLGTTRTGVAVCDRGNYPFVSFTGPDGELLDWYPSVVAERNGKLAYGIDALDRARRGGWTALRSFKRILSDPATHVDTTVVLGSSILPVSDLITGFLEALRRDLVARSNLPVPVEPGEPMQAIVATPAHAHSTQRFVTLEAFRRAGFEVVAMLAEPSAAGVEYAHRFRSTITSRRETILVYDLGGGTFDASIVDMRDREHEVVATAGRPSLGGDDFDAILFELALEAAGLDERQLSPRSRGLLINHCREQKERIHANSTRVFVEVGAHLDQIDRTIAAIAEDLTVAVSTKSYYEACMPLVDRTFEVVDEVLTRRGAAPDDALDGIAGVYVVGGASALPVVRRALRERFGSRVRNSSYPSAATAIGLAIAFDDRSPFALTERFLRHFGVFREARDGQAVAFDVLVGADTALPAPPSAPSNLVRTYRARHNVGHFRFLECSWLDDVGGPNGHITPFAEVLFPFDPALRGEACDLTAVPVERRADDGPYIEERYTVDAAGVVDLTIRDLDTGFERRHQITRGPLPGPVSQSSAIWRDASS